MGLARVEERFTTVLKDYKDADRERYNFELYAYQFLSWATPELFCHGEFWIEMERLTPILDLGPDRSRKYRDPLRRLLSRLHETGWWHCDVDLVNVVVHPVRGPLLIDWENLREAEGSISYDLYGADTAGVEPAWGGHGGSGVWWNSLSPTSPGNYWG